MSRIGYTSSTYPLPACKFFDWTTTGSSIEFGSYQSRVCIPNGVVIALTTINLIVCVAIWAFGIYLTIKECVRVKEWSDTKKFCILYFIGALGATLTTLSDFIGSPTWNSVAWYLMTIGVCTMEAVTVMVWARITLKITQTKKLLGVEVTQQVLLRWLSVTMSSLTIGLWVVLLPLFVLRALWHKFDDPWWYNILMLVYFSVMVPWIAVFAITLNRFNVKLITLLSEALQQIDQVAGVRRAGGPLGHSSSYLPGAPASETSDGQPGQAPMTKRDRLKATMRNIRMIGLFVYLDKLGFFACFSVFAIYGGLTIYDPNNGMGAYYTYASMNGLIILWIGGLLIGCGWYHLHTLGNIGRQNSTNEKTSSSAAPAMSTASYRNSEFPQFSYQPPRASESPEYRISPEYRSTNYIAQPQFSTPTNYMGPPPAHYPGQQQYRQ